MKNRCQCRRCSCCTRTYASLDESTSIPSLLQLREDGIRIILLYGAWHSSVESIMFTHLVRVAVTVRLVARSCWLAQNRIVQNGDFDIVRFEMTTR